MASLLSVCSKLEDHAYDEVVYVPPVVRNAYVSSLVDVDALLAAGTQLLRLKLPRCSNLTNLAPLEALVKLQSLKMTGCEGVSDLAPLTAC
jgi:hypothetical protein